MKRREALMAMIGGVVGPLFTRTNLFAQEPVLDVTRSPRSSIPTRSGLASSPSGLGALLATERL
jgi:hypothetical protein